MEAKQDIPDWLERYATQNRRGGGRSGGRRFGGQFGSRDYRQEGILCFLIFSSSTGSISFKLIPVESLDFKLSVGTTLNENQLVEPEEKAFEVFKFKN